jgi:ketosteroid isomerase-like protein
MSAHRMLACLAVVALAVRNDSAIGERYAKDAVFMPPNQPRIEGRDGIRQ